MTPAATLASASALVAKHRALARAARHELDRTYHRRTAARVYWDVVRWLRRPL